jgi:mRNA interferase MazF
MARVVTRRGQFVIVALQGDRGRPRPALIVQSDLHSGMKTVALCPLTTTLSDEPLALRIDVLPTMQNGLRERSQIAIDKIIAARVDRIGAVIGTADDELMIQVNRALAVLLGLAEPQER